MKYRPMDEATELGPAARMNLHKTVEKESIFNLSSASAQSEATSKDDGYFSRTGESFAEDSQLHPLLENSLQVR